MKRFVSYFYLSYNDVLFVSYVPNELHYKNKYVKQDSNNKFQYYFKCIGIILKLTFLQPLGYASKLVPSMAAVDGIHFINK